MKKLLILLTLFLAMVSACRNNKEDNVSPASDDLYRTWHLTQKVVDGVIVPPVGTNQATVTFLPDGKFPAGASQVSSCCGPVSYEATKTILRFIWDTSNPVCALVDCVASDLTGGIDWQIDKLTSDTLVLKHEGIMLTFTSQ